MAKIRHIAYRAVDVDAMAKFFVDAMGMKMIQKRKNNAIDLSDGSVNITVLPLAAGHGRPGRHRSHRLFRRQRSGAVPAAGSGRREKAGAVNLGTAYYEDKYKGPEGIIVDVGHWQGAAPVEINKVRSNVQRVVQQLRVHRLAL